MTRRGSGFSLVELMVAMAIGLVLIDLTINVYLAQIQNYRTSNAQAAIQSAQNAIAALVMPVIRSAGFCGCSSVVLALSNLNAGGPPPIGTLGTMPSMVMGYNANGSTFTLTQANAANDTNVSNWTPALDASLKGLVQRGNDVLVILGTAPNNQPVGVTSATQGSNAVVVQNASGPGVAVGQYAAVSDCVKASVFKITGISGTTITHAAGSGALNNATDLLAVNYPIGAQFIPLQQTAFFVGQGVGGQSALMRATLNGSTWTVEPLIPGINSMQVQYGIGSKGIITRYVTANLVTNWSLVYALRVSFLMEGQIGSGASNSTTTSQFTVLDMLVTTNADNRLRHTYDMTIHLRNAL